MELFFTIVFGFTAFMVLLWIVVTTFRTAKQNAKMRREIYNKELENQLRTDSKQTSEDKNED